MAQIEIKPAIEEFNKSVRCFENAIHAMASCNVEAYQDGLKDAVNKSINSVEKIYKYYLIRKNPNRENDICSFKATFDDLLNRAEDFGVQLHDVDLKKIKAYKKIRNELTHNGIQDFDGLLVRDILIFLREEFIQIYFKDDPDIYDKTCTISSNVISLISNQQIPKPMFRAAQKNLIDRYTQLFGGRKFELDNINAFLTSQQKGYIFIVGKSGYGKSALIANLINSDEDRYIWCFVNKNEKRNSRKQFLQQMIEQFMIYFRIPVVIKDFQENEDLLESQYAEFMARQIPSESKPMIMIIDGIDEAQDDFFNEKYFPRNLPDGKFVIFSARTNNTDEANQYLKRFKLPTGIKTINLEGIDQTGIADILEKKSFDGDIQKLSEEIYRRSKGDSFYVRLLIEDVLENPNSPVQIHHQPEGLNDYLDTWWTQLYDEILSTTMEKDLAANLLGLLTASSSPIPELDIYKLLPEIQTSFPKISRALHRWISESNIDNKIYYSICHPRLQEYLDGSSHATTLNVFQFQIKLRAYYADWQDHPTEFILDNYPRYLVDNKKWDELQSLILTFDTQKGIYSWAEANYGISCSYSNYLSDLRLVIDRAIAEENYETQLQCMLIRSTILSISRNVPVNLMKQLVEHNIWTPQTAFDAAIQFLPSTQDRNKLIVEVASFLPEELRKKILLETLAKMEKDDPIGKELFTCLLDSKFYNKALTFIQKINNFNDLRSHLQDYAATRYQENIIDFYKEINALQDSNLLVASISIAQWDHFRRLSKPDQIEFLQILQITTQKINWNEISTNVPSYENQNWQLMIEIIVAVICSGNVDVLRSSQFNQIETIFSKLELLIFTLSILDPDKQLEAIAIIMQLFSDPGWDENQSSGSKTDLLKDVIPYVMYDHNWAKKIEDEVDNVQSISERIELYIKMAENSEGELKESYLFYAQELIKEVENNKKLNLLLDLIPIIPQNEWAIFIQAMFDAWRENPGDDNSEKLFQTLLDVNRQDLAAKMISLDNKGELTEKIARHHWNILDDNLVKACVEVAFRGGTEEHGREIIVSLASRLEGHLFEVWNQISKMDLFDASGANSPLTNYQLALKPILTDDLLEELLETIEELPKFRNDIINQKGRLPPPRFVMANDIYNLQVKLIDKFLTNLENPGLQIRGIRCLKSAIPHLTSQGDIVDAYLALLSHSDETEHEQILRQALSSLSFVNDQLNRMELLSCMLPFIVADNQYEVLLKVIDILPDHMQAEGICKIAKDVSERYVQDLLERLVVLPGDTSIQAITALLPRIPDNLLNMLDEFLKIEHLDSNFYMQVAIRLAKAGFLTRAMDAAEKVGIPNYRADAYCEMAPYLNNHEDLTRVLQFIRTSAPRKVLYLFDYLPQDEFKNLADQLIESGSTDIDLVLNIAERLDVVSRRSICTKIPAYIMGLEKSRVMWGFSYFGRSTDPVVSLANMGFVQEALQLFWQMGDDRDRANWYPDISMRINLEQLEEVFQNASVDLLLSIYENFSEDLKIQAIEIAGSKIASHRDPKSRAEKYYAWLEVLPSNLQEDWLEKGLSDIELLDDPFAQCELFIKYSDKLVENLKADLIAKVLQISNEFPYPIDRTNIQEKCLPYLPIEQQTAIARTAINHYLSCENPNQRPEFGLKDRIYKFILYLPQEEQIQAIEDLWIPTLLEFFSGFWYPDYWEEAIEKVKSLKDSRVILMLFKQIQNKEISRYTIGPLAKLLVEFGYFDEVIFLLNQCVDLKEDGKVDIISLDWRAQILMQTCGDFALAGKARDLFPLIEKLKDGERITLLQSIAPELTEEEFKSVADILTTNKKTSGLFDDLILKDFYSKAGIKNMPIVFDLMKDTLSESYQASLISSIASSIEDSLIPRALAITNEMEESTDKAEALIRLSKRYTGQKKEDILTTALTMLEKPDDNDWFGKDPRINLLEMACLDIPDALLPTVWQITATIDQERFLSNLWKILIDRTPRNMLANVWEKIFDPLSNQPRSTLLTHLSCLSDVLQKLGDNQLLVSLTNSLLQVACWHP